jgi:hypothetical protein
LPGPKNLGPGEPSKYYEGNKNYFRENRKNFYFQHVRKEIIHAGTEEIDVAIPRIKQFMDSWRETFLQQTGQP